MMTPAIDQAHDQGSAASERARHFIAWGGRKRKKARGSAQPIEPDSAKRIQDNQSQFLCLPWPGFGLAWPDFGRFGINLAGRAAIYLYYSVLLSA